MLSHWEVLSFELGPSSQFTLPAQNSFTSPARPVLPNPPLTQNPELRTFVPLSPVPLVVRHEPCGLDSL
jgi:hypothetical protein